jgi:LPS sulfotransferase NodH
LYEELMDTRAVTIGRVLDALGISPREPEGKKGPMTQHADDVSHVWVARFRQEDADHQLTS